MNEIASSVTRKGQVTIPAAIRERLGIATPHKIAFVLEDGGAVTLRPVTLTVRALRGIVPPLSGRDSLDFEDQIEEALEEEAAHIAGAEER